MAGLVPAIHALTAHKQGVDARDMRGHDEARLRWVPLAYSIVAPDALITAAHFGISLLM
jgi:hypothetical protein